MCGLGAIRVWVQHSDYTGGAHVRLERDEQPLVVRDLIKQPVQRECLAYDRQKQTRFYTQ